MYKFRHLDEDKTESATCKQRCLYIHIPCTDNMQYTRRYVAAQLQFILK